MLKIYKILNINAEYDEIETLYIVSDNEYNAIKLADELVKEHETISWKYTTNPKWLVSPIGFSFECENKILDNFVK